VGRTLEKAWETALVAQRQREHSRHRRLRAGRRVAPGGDDVVVVTVYRAEKILGWTRARSTAG
jgi:hypothetical protein